MISDSNFDLQYVPDQVLVFGFCIALRSLKTMRGKFFA